MTEAQAYSFSVLLGRDLSIFGWSRVLGVPLLPTWDQFPSGAYEFALIQVRGDEPALNATKLRWLYMSPPPLSWGGVRGAYRFLGNWNDEPPRLAEPDYWSRVVTEHRDDPVALIRTLARFD